MLELSKWATAGSFRFREGSLIVNAQSGRTGASHWRCPTTIRYCECWFESSDSPEAVVSVVVITVGVEASLQSVMPNSSSILVKSSWLAKMSIPSLVIWRTRPINLAFGPSSLKWRVPFGKAVIRIPFGHPRTSILWLLKSCEYIQPIWFHSSESKLRKLFREECLPLSWSCSQSIYCSFKSPHQVLVRNTCCS